MNLKVHWVKEKVQAAIHLYTGLGQTVSNTLWLWRHTAPVFGDTAQFLTKRKSTNDGMNLFLLLTHLLKMNLFGWKVFVP